MSKDYTTAPLLILDPEGSTIGSGSALIWKAVDGSSICVRVTAINNSKVSYKFNRSYLYVSKSLPTSGIPCNFQYENIYVDDDGIGEPASSDEFTIPFEETDFYLIYYADICENIK